MHYNPNVLAIVVGAFPERLVTIEEMNRYYQISDGHIKKVVNRLTREGFLESFRGRKGGVYSVRITNFATC